MPKVAQESNVSQKSSWRDERSRYLRSLIMVGIEAAKRGHLGSAFSLVEIVRVLYDDIMNYRSQDPRWPDRDRFILSKGHGCMAMYAMLADKGFIELEELKTYTMDGSRLNGCSENIVPGIEATTGSLGHGLSIGVGMAIAARIQKRPSRIYVVLGDGELNEGSVWEAALSASKHKLSHLTVIIDYNKLQSEGATKDIMNLEPLKDKWESFGFETKEVDGHDVPALHEMFKSLPFSSDKPSTIIAHTIKAKGMPSLEGDFRSHWKSGLNEEILGKMKLEMESA